MVQVADSEASSPVVKAQSHDMSCPIGSKVKSFEDPVVGSKVKGKDSSLPSTPKAKHLSINALLDSDRETAKTDVGEVDDDENPSMRRFIVSVHHFSPLTSKLPPSSCPLRCVPVHKDTHHTCSPVSVRSQKASILPCATRFWPEL